MLVNQTILLINYLQKAKSKFYDNVFDTYPVRVIDVRDILMYIIYTCSLSHIVYLHKQRFSMALWFEKNHWWRPKNQRTLWSTVKIMFCQNQLVFENDIQLTLRVNLQVVFLWLEYAMFSMSLSRMKMQSCRYIRVITFINN